MSQEKGYEEWAPVGYQAPIDANNADATIPSASTGIDMSLWDEILIYVQCGVLNDSATDAVTCSDSPTTNGSYTAISGKTLAIVGTDDGKIFTIRIGCDELNAGARFVRIVHNNSAHSQLIGTLVIGKAVNPPATDNDLTVAQTPVD